MRQRVSDQQIDRAIIALYARNPQWADGHPSVREVARLLKSEAGHRGTTQRICDALRRHRANTGTGESDPDATVMELAQSWRTRAQALVQELAAHRHHAETRIRALETALQQTRARADLAEEREERNQDVWAEKLYALQQQLQQAGPRPMQGVSFDQYLAVHRDLKAARDELAELRAQLAAGGKPPR